MESTLEYILTAGVIFVIVYCFSTSTFDYWGQRGVPGPEPVPLFGNFARAFLQLSAHVEVFSKLYRDWRKQPFFGIYKGRAPVLVVNDLDLVKNIMIRDFHAFPGRGLRINEDVDPLAAHLFVIEGPRWKYLRAKLSPVFTSGKLKHMFDLMLECADHFETYLREQVGAGSILECREVAAKFTTDVIGSCAFGINMNAMDREDSDFRRIGRKVMTIDNVKLLKIFIRDSAPWLFRLLKLRVFDKDITDFFINTIRETMDYRTRENFVRNDLVDILLSIKKSHDNKEFELTDELLTAQAFVFFLAGFETSSSTISFALYELAFEPTAQEKLQSEILEFFKRHKGKVTYETIKEMTYLDMVVQETLRKNPPVPVLERQAGEPYKIPNSDLILEKGTKVSIPVYAIHHDPEYWPRPEEFDPERFTDEAKSGRHHMTYLPFGDGPKNCIGARFAAYQVKLGIIKVLKNYRVKPTKMSPMPYELKRSLFLLVPKNGVHLKFEPL